MTQNDQKTRRDFLRTLAAATGSVVLMPLVSACSSAPEVKAPATPESMPTEMPSSDKMKDAAADAAKDKAKDMAMDMSVPKSKPDVWDPVNYNKVRGNAGAIPETYHASINGPDGDKKHLGKHLPYQPETEPGMVPAGFIAIMWGDPAKGYAKHPNAAKSDDNPEGHWYNWIKIRKATDEDAQEMKSEYVTWPGTGGDDKQYAVLGGGEMTAEKGKNTIYMAALPADVKPGDTVRIYAHCLTHGEYVDFMTV